MHCLQSLALFRFLPSLLTRTVCVKAVNDLQALKPTSQFTSHQYHWICWLFPASVYQASWGSPFPSSLQPCVASDCWNDSGLSPSLLLPFLNDLILSYSLKCHMYASLSNLHFNFHIYPLKPLPSLFCALLVFTVLSLSYTIVYPQRL